MDELIGQRTYDTLDEVRYKVLNIADEITYYNKYASLTKAEKTNLQEELALLARLLKELADEVTNTFNELTEEVRRCENN